MSHSVINSAILYWGTPVVLITTTNSDGTTNIAPMSSTWWLSNIAMLGLEATSQTTQNLYLSLTSSLYGLSQKLTQLTSLRTKQCVLNLPTSSMTTPINALAKTTGTPIVPDSKLARGYRHVKDKFTQANLTPQPSHLVATPRIAECPVQMEAQLLVSHDLLTGSAMQGFALALEVKILRTHVADDLRLAGYENRIDADAWRPMIMSFQELYGLGKEGKIVKSRLAEVEEELYRAPVEDDS